MTRFAAKGLTIKVISVFLAILFIAGCSGRRQPDITEPRTQYDNTGNTESDYINNTTEPEPSPASDNDPQKGNNGESSQSTEGTEETGNDGKGDENSGEQKPELVKVKALYLTGWVAGTSSLLDQFIEIVKTTEVNALVIDIKDDDGYVGYKSNIPDVINYNASLFKYDVDKTLKKLHENGVHVIGRLVCFKDPVLSTKRPDLAVKTQNGELWKDNQKCTWLDPYNRESWPYIISIAREAVEKGFDEIQFDYVRFPNDGDKKNMKFNDDGKPKYEIINEFLAYARQELPNVILSADIFGIVCESPEDTEDIGQYLELIGENIDYISPMVYPSHYALGQIVNGVKFDKPDFDPYGVVYNTLVKAQDRLSKVEGHKPKIRPYLQDFTAKWLGSGYYMVYGPEEVKKQIQAVEDAGLEEWILWDAENTYSVEGLRKE